MKYPIGTRIINKDYVKIDKDRVHYWVVGEPIAPNSDFYWVTNDNGVVHKLNPAIFTKPRWYIEYPKEDLFTKLYLRLKTN